MYLSKKQMKALEVAMDALQMGVENNIQVDESCEAIGVIADMRNKARKQINKRKRIK